MSEKSVNSTEKIKSIKKVTKIRAKIEKKLWKFLCEKNAISFKREL